MIMIVELPIHPTASDGFPSIRWCLGQPSTNPRALSCDRMTALEILLYLSQIIINGHRRAISCSIVR